MKIASKIRSMISTAGLFLSLTVPSASSAATPGFDTLVNYDTAWTFVYDGGKTPNIFSDVKCLPNGVCRRL